MRESEKDQREREDHQGVKERENEQEPGGREGQKQVEPAPWSPQFMPQEAAVFPYQPFKFAARLSEWAVARKQSGRPLLGMLFQSRIATAGVELD